jgi:hypothetical protein
MGDRYYLDEFDNRQSYHRDMLQMQRDQRKAEARSNRDARRDEQQKAKDDLFNGKKREIAKSTTRDNKQRNGAEDDVKQVKKDQKNGGAGAGAGAGEAYDDSELRALINALESRLNSASIDAECGEGSVTVTLNI